MPLTVSGLQATLSGLCGGLMTLAGLDGSASSPAFLFPLAKSALDLGLSLNNPLTVQDSDLTGVAPSQVVQLVEVAELRALESALGNFQLVTVKWSLANQETDLNAVRKTLEDAIARKAAYVKERYGVGRGTVTVGSVPLGYVERCFPEFCP